MWHLIFLEIDFNFPIISQMLIWIRAYSAFFAFGFATLCQASQNVLSHSFSWWIHSTKSYQFSVCHVRKHQPTSKTDTALNCEHLYHRQWCFSLNMPQELSAKVGHAPRKLLVQGFSLNWCKVPFTLIRTSGVVVYDKTLRMPKNRFGWSKSWFGIWRNSMGICWWLMVSWFGLELIGIGWFQDF